MAGVGIQEKRQVLRTQGRYIEPSVFADNTLGGLAYIHLEGFSHVAQQPKTGILNEANRDGCSIIISDTEWEPLVIGTPCYLRLEDGNAARAVLKWRHSFGKNASKVGFQFIN